MGREVRRVSSDFEWPLNKVWEGFLNPHYAFSKECPFCKGSGYSPEAMELEKEWYGHDDEEWEYIAPSRRYNKKAWQYNLDRDDVQALVDNDRLRDFTHRWTGKKWKKKDPPVIPTPEEVNKWAINNPLGICGSGSYICIKAKTERLGLPHQCEYCKGEGNIWYNKKHQKDSEEWEPTDPPTGNYYQLWETTSEGSPISPPCKTPEKLAQWLADKKASSFGSHTESYDTWLKFIKGPGWAPSAIGTVGKGLESGVKGVVDK